MAHNINYQMKDYRLIYEDIRGLLQEDDLSFTNAEFPMMDSQPQTSYPSFNIHSEYLYTALEAGFDVVSLANNHSCDKGEEGVFETYSRLKTMETEIPFRWNGIFHTQSERFIPEVWNQEGISIAFFSITALSNSVNGLDYINYLPFETDRELRMEFLSLLREYDRYYDLIIVGIHGGVEYALYPTEEQIEFYREMTRFGADIVWGSHPHVVQPYEILSGEQGDQLIIYSNGNLISGQGTLIDPSLIDNPWNLTCESVLFQVNLQITEGTIHIEQVNLQYFFNLLNFDGDYIIGRMPEYLNEHVNDYEPLWRNYYLERQNAFQGSIHRLRD